MVMIVVKTASKMKERHTERQEVIIMKLVSITTDGVPALNGSKAGCLQKDP